MTEINIGEIVMYYWSIGRRVRHTPSGWTGSNSVCCQHRGFSPDKRGRGGVITSTDGSFAYSCFNCGFKTAWEPGNKINFKCRQLFEWLNIPDDIIRKMSFHALSLSENTKLQTGDIKIITFNKIDLPDDFIKVDENTPLKILSYIAQRRLENHLDELYYSNSSGYKNRLIFPIVYQNKTIGWTGRSVTNSSPRYLSNQQPGCVYGLDKQRPRDKFVFVTEGLIDAMHIRGVSLLGSSISDSQYELIKRLNKTAILIPDRDKNGKELVNVCLDHGWKISLPEWDLDIKDVSDAVDRYGRLATFISVITGVKSTSLKTQLEIRKWFINEHN